MYTYSRQSTSAGLGLLLALTLQQAANAQDATFPSLTATEIVPNQYIMRTAPGANVAGVTEALKARQIDVIETLPLLGMQIVSAPQAQFGALAAQALQIRGVAYIEPVFRVQIDAAPADPQYPEQWGYERINAPLAWNTRNDSGEIVVGVIDTGVDYKHPDIAANMWTNTGETAGNNVDDDGNGVVDDVFGANFVADDVTTGDPMDDNRHGTHVAGTIGAVTDNHLGVAGVNWKTKIMALKFLSASGSGSTAGAIRAIEYGIKMGVNVMNNSWGGGGFSRALEDAIRIADNKGILFVAAAGNVGDNDNDSMPHYPSSYEVPNVLSVMATGEDDSKASFSSFGQASVDLAAPGVGILSTVPGGAYDSFNGTSMATPHVAGAAALVWAQYPDLTHHQIKSRLMDSAEVIPGLAAFSVTGARLDLAKAIGNEEDSPLPLACKSKQHAQLTYNEFLWSDSVQVGKNSNLLSVSFKLPEKMSVTIAANGSGRRVRGDGNTIVRTGLFNQNEPNNMWSASYRRINFANALDDKIISTSFSTVLPKGQHTIFWKLWVADATMQLGSGTLTVQGVPCVMGGKLQRQLADRVDITESDPRLRVRTEQLKTDQQGNSVTTDK